MRFASLVALLLFAPAAAAQIPALDAPREAADARDGETFDVVASWAPGAAWMGSVDVDVEAYGGGLSRSRFFVLGEATTTAADDVPVEIRFDETEVTLAPVFRANANWSATAVGTFRGSAWDMSDPAAPRRLNVAFTERGGTSNADGVWGPDGSSQGDLELLFVMNSDYDGTGETYLGNGLFSTPMDLLYSWFPRLASGRSPYETSPATLAVEFAYVRDLAATGDDGTVTLTWGYDLSEGDAFRVLRAADGGAFEAVATVPLGERTFADPGLPVEPLYRYRVLVVDAAGEPVHTSAEATVRASRSENVDLVGVYDARGGYADVWGYTAPDGREYALGALQSSGLVILDVTGDTPVEVGFVPTAADANDSKDVKVYQNYAYLVNESGPIQIIDLTDPANPVEVGQLITSVSDPGAHNVLVADDHLWTTGGPSPGGVQVWALQPDPTAPTFAGSFEPFYYHDFEIRDGIGFGPGIYGDGIDVLDVSDPADISLITRFNYPGSGAHNTCTTPDLSHVYVGDEIGSSGNWTRVFDLADYQNENVELVGDVVVDASAVVHNCYVHEGRLYVAHYTEGLQVFDVATDPAVPTRVGFFDTYPDSGYGYNGAWSVYPFFDSGKILVSDRSYGLFVLRLGGAVANEDGGTATAALALSAAPNPARTATTLSFELPRATAARLAVYDALGREVAVLVDDVLGAGAHTARLDGAGLPAGLYLVRLAAEGAGVATRSVVLTR